MDDMRKNVRVVYCQCDLVCCLDMGVSLNGGDPHFTPQVLIIF